LSIELGLPILAAFTTSIRLVRAIWLCFFANILGSLEVPFLFVTSYGAAVLLLGDPAGEVPTAREASGPA
jgi:hypothetical protein